MPPCARVACAAMQHAPHEEANIESVDGALEGWGDPGNYVQHIPGSYPRTSRAVAGLSSARGGVYQAFTRLAKLAVKAGLQ